MLRTSRTLKTSKRKSNLLKGVVARLMLFGIPFALSYLATRPVLPSAAGLTYVVCGDALDRPGELRISLDPAGCSKEVEAEEPAKTVPAGRSIPGTSRNPANGKAVTLPF